MRSHGRALVFTLIYVMVAGLYIWLSGRIALRLAPDPEHLSRIEALKGTAFVIVTGGALFLLMWTALRRAERDAEEIRASRQALLASERRAAAGLLAASVAHDCNNLIIPLHMGLDELNGLVGAAGPEAATRARAVRREIDDAVARLSELSQRLATAGRETAGRATPLDLVQVVRGSVEVARRHARVKPCEVFIAGPDRLPLAANAGLLDQVILNLLLNAAEAGAGRMEVRVFAGEEAAALEVHDDGPGIANKSDAFKPFFTTKSTGTGLGLFSVKACAELHGGKAEVRDSPLGGACVRITLPLAAAA